jgi:exodeoxyribonuclease V gamma subunit
MAPALVTDRLPAPAPTPTTIALDDLVRFLQHPVRGFLRQRLDVATYTGEDEPADALTVELDGLQGWAIGDRVLRRCVAGTGQRVAAQLEYLRGELPPGALGQRQLQTIGRRVDTLLAACATERAEAPTAVDVSVALADGRVLAGTVGGVRGATILDVTYSTLKAKQRLAAWVRYVALVAGTDDADVRAVTVGRRRDDPRRATLHGVPPHFARQCLDLLVRIRDAGLREPLPLALETSEQYADRRQRGASIDDALPAARVRWAEDRFAPERDDPEHVLVFGANVPFDRLTAAAAAGDPDFPDEPTRFGALARSVWGPLLMVEELR